MASAPVGAAWYIYYADPRADHAPLVLSIEVATFCGYIVARFGESLVFGSRRAPSWSEAHPPAPQTTKEKHMTLLVVAIAPTIRRAG